MTLTAGMLVLVRTIVEAPDEGWTEPATLAAFALAVALLGAFVAIERRSRSPLVRLGILRNGPLVRANLGMMALFGSYVGFQFVMTLYLQTMNGWSAVETALAFLPAGMLVALGSTRIGPLVDRFGTARVIAAGALSSALGYALVLRFDASPEYVAVLLPTMLLIGIGFMLGFPTMNIQGTNGVGDHEQGLASGLVQTSFQIGGAIGLAIVTAVVSGHAGGSPDPDTLLEAYRIAIGVNLAIAVAGLLVALSGLDPPRATRGSPPRPRTERPGGGRPARPPPAQPPPEQRRQRAAQLALEVGPRVRAGAVEVGADRDPLVAQAAHERPALPMYDRLDPVGRRVARVERPGAAVARRHEQARAAQPLGELASGRAPPRRGGRCAGRPRSPRGPPRRRGSARSGSRRRRAGSARRRTTRRRGTSRGCRAA